MQGTIQRVIRGKGFGFILADNRQYFFHHTEIQNAPFKRLGIGDVVEFQPRDEETEGRNPRAVEIVVVQQKERPASRKPQGGRGRRRAPATRRGDSGPFPRLPKPLPEGDDEFGNVLDGSADADDLEFVSGVDGTETRPRPPQRRGPPQKRAARRPRATGAPGEPGEGVIRFLDATRGFGFIRTPAGDVFFDRHSVRGGIETIARGARVAFVFADGERGTRADQVAPLG